MAHGNSGKLEHYDYEYDTHHGKNQTISHPFPEYARGFLYYHPPPDHVPQTAGDVRFRVTPSDDPSSFSEGFDLRRPNGALWREHLLFFTRDIHKPISKYHAMRQLLLDDGLVTPQLLEKCKDLMMRAGQGIVRQSRIIHSVGQLFPIDFNVAHLSTYVLTEDALQPMTITSPFTMTMRNRPIVPFGGKYIFRSELSLYR